MALPLCFEYVDIVRDIFGEIQRIQNRSAGKPGLPGLNLKKHLEPPQHWQTSFADDRRHVLVLLRRAVDRMIADHVIIQYRSVPATVGVHPDFHPKTLDPLPLPQFNWITACRTENVLSDETKDCIVRLKVFLRSHYANNPPGDLAGRIKAYTYPETVKGKGKRRAVEAAAQVVKRQNQSHTLSETAAVLQSNTESSLPSQSLPSGSQLSPAGPSTDISILARLEAMENIVKQQNTVVLSCNNTMSELDECLADHIARCTERKEEAKLVSEKVDRLEDIQETYALDTVWWRAKIEAQDARIKQLELELGEEKARNRTRDGVTEESEGPQTGGEEVHETNSADAKQNQSRQSMEIIESRPGSWSKNESNWNVQESG